MNDVIREKAISLAKAIAESEEYVNFLDKEDALKKMRKPRACWQNSKKSSKNLSPSG